MNIVNKVYVYIEIYSCPLLVYNIWYTYTTVFFQILVTFYVFFPPPIEKWSIWNHYRTG